MAGLTEADRQRVVEELRRRAALGQLSTEELEDRIDRAHTVVTSAGLDGLLLDLPGAPDRSSARPWALPDAGSETGGPTSWATPGAATPTPSPPAGPSAPMTSPTTGRPRPTTAVAVVVAAVAVVGLLMLGLLAAGGQSSDDPPESGVAVATTVPEPEPATTEPTEPDTAPAPTAPIAPSTPSATTAPPTTRLPSDPIVLIVGRDIQPGRYTSVPLVDNCSWERVHTNENGVLDDSLASGGGVRPIMEVLPTDSAIVVRGCGPWLPHTSPATPATSMGDGDWLVGGDVAPGHYRVTVPVAVPDWYSSYCSWERGRGFTYDEADTIETNFDDKRTEVDLVEGERFSSDGCGTWTRQ